MQIETLDGYKNLNEILSVKGIDCIFIGAADLSRSIAGSEGNFDLERVYADICKRVRDAGIYLGAAVGASLESAKKAKDNGVQFVVFGQDSRILSGGLKKNLDFFKNY